MRHFNERHHVVCHGPACHPDSIWQIVRGIRLPEAGRRCGDLTQHERFANGDVGNFKLPAPFVGMLLPLRLLGSGGLSIDVWIRRHCSEKTVYHPEYIELSCPTNPLSTMNSSRKCAATC